MGHGCASVGSGEQFRGWETIQRFTQRLRPGLTLRSTGWPGLNRDGAVMDGTYVVTFNDDGSTKAIVYQPFEDGPPVRSRSRAATAAAETDVAISETAWKQKMRFMVVAGEKMILQNVGSLGLGYRATESRAG